MLSSWDSNPSVVILDGSFSVGPHGGSKQAGFFNPYGSAGGVAQTINTVIGQTYGLSFWLASTGDCLDACWIDVSFGDDLVASSSFTSLRFYLMGQNGEFVLDDISVVAMNTPAGVPEPATLALTAIALLGAGAASRRCRTAA